METFTWEFSYTGDTVNGSFTAVHGQRRTATLEEALSSIDHLKTLKLVSCRDSSGRERPDIIEKMVQRYGKRVVEGI